MSTSENKAKVQGVEAPGATANKASFAVPTSSREAGGMSILDPLAEKARIAGLRVIRDEEA